MEAAVVGIGRPPFRVSMNTVARSTYSTYVYLEYRVYPSVFSIISRPPAAATHLGATARLRRKCPTKDILVIRRTRLVMVLRQVYDTWSSRAYRLSRNTSRYEYRFDSILEDGLIRTDTPMGWPQREGIATLESCEIRATERTRRREKKNLSAFGAYSVYKSIYGRAACDKIRGGSRSNKLRLLSLNREEKKKHEEENEENTRAKKRNDRKGKERKGKERRRMGGGERSLLL